MNIAAIDEIVRGTSSPLEPSLAQSEATITQNFDFFNLPTQLKRKTWTEEEIDAVNVSLCLKIAQFVYCLSMLTKLGFICL